MRYSRTEWLLIISVFGLSIAANLSADLQTMVPINKAALQIMLCALLVFALVRYTPLPIVITVSMLFVGSGLPWILDEYFNVSYWVSLAIIAFMLLLAAGYRTLSKMDEEAPAKGGTAQSVQSLFTVVGRGNLAWTYRLIAMGADVNVRNEAGQTPLMLAAEKGYADMVQILIQHGANPKLANNQGESALTIALMKGYTRIAESLELAESKDKYSPVEGGT